MERNIIFFDLDGTLTDPMLGITRSVQHALKAYDIIEEDLTRLIPFIGTYGLDEDEWQTFTPDEDSLQQAIIELFYEKN